MQRLGLVLAAAMAAACGDDASPVMPDAGGGGSDAGTDAPAPVLDGGLRCGGDGDCGDGLYCNGVEVCVRGFCQPGIAPACDDGRACTTDRCSEEERDCLNQAPDLDIDGHVDESCGGDDCDDSDPLRYAGAAEVCDVDNRDEDCNPATIGVRDLDDDGFVDAACCNGTTCGDDCDDTRDSVHRTASEVCDGFDNDCNGATDEGLRDMTWPDPDDDRWGDASATPESTCGIPTGRVDRGGDCDESSRLIHPDAVELCDDVDNDCDAMVDDGAAAECEGRSPGTTAICMMGGVCHVLACSGSRFDCNADGSDGCEVDTCTDSASCDACGYSCGARACFGGRCEGFAEAMGIYFLTDAVTGAPIVGATVTVIGSCRSYTTTTDGGGGYTLPFGATRYARVEATGYPVHIQPVDRTVGVGTLIPQSLLDAWLADPDLVAAPSMTQALVIASYEPGSRDAPHTMLPLRDQPATGSDLLPGSGAADRQIFFDVLPGRARIGGSISMDGCSTNCGPGFELLLLPGTVTHVGSFACRTACS